MTAAHFDYIISAKSGIERCIEKQSALYKSVFADKQQQCRNSVSKLMFE